MTKEAFIQSLKQIDWFANCCSPDSAYHVIGSIFEAYDDWNGQYLQAWEPQITALEQIAQTQMSDEEIDTVFAEISDALNSVLWEKWCAFIERKQLEEEAGLEEEMLDMVKRDMAWAYVEQALHRNGFFTNLLTIYKAGHFPCAWEGNYPSGNAVVL